MICPQTQKDCWHPKACGITGCAESIERTLNGGPKPRPTKPTMAEIERLVDAYGAAMTEYRIHGVVSVLMDARAVLMASIKQYVEG